MARGTKVDTKSERLQLVTAISNMSQIQEKFIKSVEALEHFKYDSLTKLDLEIGTKKLELDTLENDYNRMIKDNEIKINQHLSEFKYNGALEILKERSEVAIAEEKLDEMSQELKDLKSDRQSELDSIREKEKSRSEKALKSAINNANLVHKAEVAELQASVNQQLKEINNLQETINNLRHELSEQRKLTKEVAEAGKPVNIPTPMYNNDRSR